MITTIIKHAATVVVLSTSAVVAQDVDLKTACEGLGSHAQEFAMMRDTGMDMVTAMNHFIEREGVVEQSHIEWVYTLATIAYENWEEAPDDVGYMVFLSCMDMLAKQKEDF